MYLFQSLLLTTYFPNKANLLVIYDLSSFQIKLVNFVLDHVFQTETLTYYEFRPQRNPTDAV